ncbi:ATP-binding cassette domain-containing protein, partial [Globicatella sulfidifaciens]
MSYIEFKDVVKEYHTGEVVTRANDGIDFTIERGEFVVILGPSGAGKSTTLNILGGMDQATSGQVLIDGEDIAQYSERKLTTYRRNSVGFVFQNYNLVPNLTAKENVELMIQIAKSGM